MPSTALIIFAFNRPGHLRQTLEKLAASGGVEELSMHYFIDGPRNEHDVKPVQEVIALAETFRHPDKSIIIRETNTGLRDSVIGGLNQVFSKYDRAIVLEDDILIHPGFLKYHLDCLDAFEEREDIWSVSGYVIPAIGDMAKKITRKDMFLAPRASSWGWSTWKDRWVKVKWGNADIFSHLKQHVRQYNNTGGDKLRMLMRELSGNSSSWAIRWDYAHFMHHAYCVYPTVSLVVNIGLDRSGTHSAPTASYRAELSENLQPPEPDLNVSEHESVTKLFSQLNRKWYRMPVDWFRFFRFWLNFK